MAQSRAAVPEELFASRSTSHQKNSPSQYRQNTEAKRSWQRKDDYETPQCVSMINAFAERLIIHTEGSSPTSCSSSSGLEYLYPRFMRSCCIYFAWTFRSSIGGGVRGFMRCLDVAFGSMIFGFLIINTRARFFLYTLYTTRFNKGNGCRNQPHYLNSSSIVICHPLGQGQPFLMRILCLMAGRQPL